MKHERLQNKLSFEMVQRRKCAPADVAWLWSVTPGSHFVQAEVALSQSTSLQHDGPIGPGGNPIQEILPTHGRNTMTGNTMSSNHSGATPFLMFRKGMANSTAPHQPPP